jgi:hypothetical protein
MLRGIVPIQQQQQMLQQMVMPSLSPAARASSHTPVGFCGIVSV